MGELRAARIGSADLEVKYTMRRRGCEITKTLVASAKAEGLTAAILMQDSGFPGVVG